MPNRRTDELFDGFTGRSTAAIAAALGYAGGTVMMYWFGVAPALMAGTQDLWYDNTQRVYPTAAAPVSVVSTDATDAGGNTGAQAVLVDGLAADGSLLQEVVPLNGTTPVESNTSFLRVNKIIAPFAGPAGTNVGVITASIGGNVQAHIEAGSGQSNQFPYSVPVEHTLVLTSAQFGVGKVPAPMNIRIQAQARRNFGQGGNAWVTAPDIALASGQDHHSGDDRALVFKGGTDLRAIVTCSGNGTAQLHGVASGFLIREEYLPA